MSQKWASRLAWGAATLVILVCIWGVGLWVGHDLPGRDLLEKIGTVGWVIFPVLVAPLAALIISRQARNLVGWLLLTSTAAFALSFLVDAYMSPYAVAPPPTDAWHMVVVLYSNFAWVFLIFPVLVIPLVFPTGRPMSRRWGWMGWALVCMAALFVLFAVTSDRLGSPDYGTWHVVNPVGFIPEATMESIISVWLIALGLLTLASVVSLFVRYRRAGYAERQQIKWLLYACGLFALVYAAGSFTNLPNQVGLANDIWNLLFILSLLAIPAAIAIAIIRYRLWDIDVIIRRTLIYGALTAALALVYFGSVILLQQTVQAVTGQRGRSQPVIVVSTLAVAALFSPLRRRLQGYIDRRFYRSRYTAERVLADFAGQVRQQTDLDALADQLQEAVRSSLQPESVFLWLRGGEEKR